jgi:hypothetical protein
MKLSERIRRSITGDQESFVDAMYSVDKAEGDSELLEKLIEMLFNLPDGQLGICAFPLKDGNYRFLQFQNASDGLTPRAAIEAAIKKYEEGK